MRTLEELHRDSRELKPRLASECHVAEIVVFGSVANGEQTAESDIDLLVAFDAPVSLFDAVRLEQERTDQLGIDVDVVTKGSFKPRIGSRVAAHVVYG